MPSEIARAKINLTLHVGAVISDPGHRFRGYHPVDSLVVFADMGDIIHCEEAPNNTLDISGPFSKGLVANPDNLILKAHRMVAQHGSIPNFSFHLEKNLPVAAGIGGGSANAAAVLRVLQSYIQLPSSTWHNMATSLGADVPVCVDSRTRIMSGIGDNLTDMQGLGQIPALLVNPGVPVSTGKIFEAFDSDTHPKQPRPQSRDETLIEKFLAGRNDLQPYTTGIEPMVKTCLNMLANLKDTQPGHVRMSGSGGTCFALFDNIDRARAAKRELDKISPDWWSIVTLLGGAP